MLFFNTRVYELHSFYFILDFNYLISEVASHYFRHPEVFFNGQATPSKLSLMHWMLAPFRSLEARKGPDWRVDIWAETDSADDTVSKKTEHVYDKHW